MPQADVPLSLLVLAAGQEGLVSAMQCDAEGFGKYRRHRLVAAGRAVLVTRGVLDLTPVLAARGTLVGGRPDEHRRRAAFLALLAHGPAAVAVGECALALLGVQGLPREIRPEVWLPPGTPRVARAGIVVRCYDGPIPTTGYAGFRVAAPEWALAQAVLRLSRDDAVAVLDSAVQRGLVGRSAVARVEKLTRGRPGARRVRECWGLVDGRSQSPLETRARLQCVDAGVPPDELQVPIRDAGGRIIARGDLGWRLRNGRWLVIEIDGAGPHSDPAALFADRRRQNAIIATRLVDPLRFTARDIARRTLIPAAVAAHLATDALDAT